MNFTTVISTTFDSLNRLKVKFLRMGKSDVQECLESSAYGTDSNPVKDMVAIYTPTGENGKNVIIGYINKNRLAEIGEHRIFSTNDQGVLSTYIWLKNDETMEIGGDADFMVRYSVLESAFNDLKGTVNDLVSAFNSHMHATAATGPPSIPTPIPSSIPAIPSTADISGAKIDEIKTL
jgi:hypothetical protein